MGNVSLITILQNIISDAGNTHSKNDGRSRKRLKEKQPAFHFITIGSLQVGQISSVGLNLLKPSADAIRGLGLKKEDILVLAQDLDRELDAHKVLFLV